MALDKFKQLTEQRLDMVRSNHNLLACILTTTMIIIVIVVVICPAIFFAEIAELEAQRNSILTLSQNTLQNLNTSIDDIRFLLDKQANQLNMSINKLYQNTLNSVLKITDLDNLSVLEYRAEQLLNLYPHLNNTMELSASSCAALLPNTPSGYYWVSASNGSAVRVYCDMTRSCGGVTGGWVRVGYLDMTNSSHQCPNGSTEHNNSNIRTCRRTDPSAGCWSVPMDVPYPYSRVCGRVRGYQVGTTNAFGYRQEPSGIDDAYMDGVSLTHNNPRQHIWTFAAGLNERTDILSSCSCFLRGVRKDLSSLGYRVASPPQFVGQDYFCETAGGSSVYSRSFYGDDPLWDGNNCASDNNCCYFNNPPWFHKQLPPTTESDNIEMRVCRDEGGTNEDVAIDIVEIYVR